MLAKTSRFYTWKLKHCCGWAFKQGHECKGAFLPATWVAVLSILGSCHNTTPCITHIHIKTGAVRCYEIKGHVHTFRSAWSFCDLNCGRVFFIGSYKEVRRGAHHSLVPEQAFQMI